MTKREGDLKNLKVVKKEDFITELYEMQSLDEQETDSYDSFRRKFYRLEGVMKEQLGLEVGMTILEREKEALLHMYTRLINSDEEESRALMQSFKRVAKGKKISLQELDKLIDLHMDSLLKIADSSHREDVLKQVDSALKVREISRMMENDLRLLSKIEPHVRHVSVIDQYVEFMEQAMGEWRSNVIDLLLWYEFAAENAENSSREDGQSDSDYHKELKLKTDINFMMYKTGLYDPDHVRKLMDRITPEKTE